MALVSIFQCQGKEVRRFLQGQLTIDIDQLKEYDLQLTAHCNAEGRVLSLFWICLFEASFYLIIPKTIQILTVQYLEYYAQFEKITLSSILTHDFLLKDFFDPNDEWIWRLRHIRQSLPLLYPQTCGIFFPHDLNLLNLGAVSLNKGCYIGQEIIARMEHFGKLKRSLKPIKYSGNTVPLPGEKIELYYDKEKGTVLDAIKEQGHIEALIVSQKK